MVDGIRRCALGMSDKAAELNQLPATAPDKDPIQVLRPQAPHRHRVRRRKLLERRDVLQQITDRDLTSRRKHRSNRSDHDEDRDQQPCLQSSLHKLTSPLLEYPSLPIDKRRRYTLENPSVNSIL